MFPRCVCLIVFSAEESWLIACVQAPTTQAPSPRGRGAGHEQQHPTPRPGVVIHARCLATAGVDCPLYDATGPLTKTRPLTLIDALSLRTSLSMLSLHCVCTLHRIFTLIRCGDCISPFPSIRCLLLLHARVRSCVLILYRGRAYLLTLHTCCILCNCCWIYTTFSPSQRLAAMGIFLLEVRAGWRPVGRWEDALGV